jgi:hypothetical protein
VRVFPSAAAFGRHFSIPFLQFPAAVCQIIALGLIVRPAVAPPPPPAILITWLNLELGVFFVHYLILRLRSPLLFPNVVKDVVTGGFFKILLIVLVLLKNGASCFRRCSSSASQVLNCVRNYCSVLESHR